MPSPNTIQRMYTLLLTGFCVCQRLAEEPVLDCGQLVVRPVDHFVSDLAQHEGVHLGGGDGKLAGGTFDPCELPVCEP